MTRRSAPDAAPVKRSVGRPSLRPQLLDAALDLIAEDGVGALTYEALSVRTGVSKGGLLYHFPSKDALLDALTERLVDRYAEARRATTEELPESPSRELKGYAIASLHNRSKADGASARLKMSGVWNRRVGKAYYARRFREMAAGMDRDRAAIVHLAVEGLWYMELAGVSPFTALERRRIVMLLLRLADGGEIEAGPSAPRGTARAPAKRPSMRATKSTR
ncbi:TetR/AcrR family transcriptional regulator [Roseomonas terrae]|uniref:TetR/AcrR family transcriptional regulator n=1 Tax=Neoroseomonas terrae TaxID=424799 RepID=A0ABS5EGU2_9PROT|nr:TetR/AcrR family transcriptional regulator [Neoroseomonas terrae]MBR0650236.1 TetR/AcrR family transcriptional regulator [Neoroseomonas terrae]